MLVFRTLDADGNGLIDPEELRLALSCNYLFEIENNRGLSPAVIE